MILHMTQGIFVGRLFTSCLLLLLVVCSGTAAAEKKAGVIRIAAEDSWPPFSDHSGNGLSRQIATEAFALSGYQIDTLVVPYARALRLVEQGEMDACWNVTRQSNTEAMYHFGEEPLLQADISFFYRANTPMHYTDFADIPNGTKIGVIIDYEYGDEFEAHKSRFQIMAVSTQKSLLYMLKAGRFDVVLMFDKVFESNIKTLGLNLADYEKGHRFYTSDIYIAFNAASPQSAVYSQALDEGLKALRKSGRYQALMSYVLE